MSRILGKYDYNMKGQATGRILKGQKDLDLRVSLLEGNSSNLTWDRISAIVKAGKAQNYFKVGDQISTKWKDTQTNTEYDIPLDVVAFRNVVTLDENNQEKTVPGMILQWHYCSPFGVQFSQNQAFYVYAEALAINLSSIS